MSARIPSHQSLGLPGWLILVGVMTAIGPVSIDLYLPAFPLIEATLHERGVERTMAGYLIGLALGQLLYGPISDRFGRKPPLYFGFVIYTVGAMGCALSDSMSQLILFRIVQAAGACSGIAIGRAVVRDRCEPEQAARAFSTLMTIISVAPILAPIGGGFIVTAFGWRAAFFFQAALGVCLLVGMHFFMTESLSPDHARSLQLRLVLSTYFRLLRDRHFISHSLVGGFAMASLFCFVAGSPTILTHVYDISPQNFGWLIGMNGLAFMSASRLNLYALRTTSPAALLARFVWLPVIVGATFVAASVLNSPPLILIIALQFAFFISTARVMPNTSALALGPHARDAGSASALLGALQSVASTLAGLAIGKFTNGLLLPLALIMTSCVLISASLHAWATHTSRRL